MDRIDAVITWVDGNCSRHRAKRATYDLSEVHPEGMASVRWQQSNEIVFLLRSLERYAPWIDNVFIVTDEQSPPLAHLSEPFRRKISIVDHRVIFAGYEEYLPTFNSVSIETMLHRIPGLAERYVQFNDDMFLVGRTHPPDFFQHKSVVLRGKLGGSLAEGILYTDNRVNAGNLLGVPAKKFFRSAHICLPMLRSLQEEFFADNDMLMRANISHRFRSGEQFLPSSLNTHLAIAADRAVISKSRDWHFVDARICQSGDRSRISRSLRKLHWPWFKFACINDYEAAQNALPSAGWHVARAVEGGILGAFRLSAQQRRDEYREAQHNQSNTPPGVN